MTEQTQDRDTLTRYVGRTALLDLQNGMRVHVTIVAVRFPFGVPTYTVEPLSGNGRADVRSHLELVPTPEPAHE